MTTHTRPASPSLGLSLQGRVALVTGSSRGIGAAIATALDAAGAQVVLVGRDHEALEGVAEGLDHDPLQIVADLKAPDAADDLLEAAFDQLGRLDVLVNNAGIADFAPSGSLTAEGIDRLLAVNVRAVLLLAGHAAAHMAEGGGGSIVNVSSVLARGGVPRASVYSATKGALEALTVSLAAEWGGSGVRVNAVRPGITRTDMAGPLLETEGWEGFYRSQTPLDRIGETSDVAALVAFLASDAASYVTGQSITVDGGWANTGRIAPGA